MRGAVLVTGASRGIGRAFAAIAAGAGHDLVLVARSGEELEALAAELRAAHGVAVRVIAADLSRPEEVERVWREAVAAGRVGMLINNAGLGYNGAFAAGDGWDRQRLSIDVNVSALTRLTHLAADHMAGGGGRILNVASLAAFLPGPGMAVYHATKAYVLALREAVATELSGSGVTVTALCPGPTESGFFDAADMRGARITRIAPVPAAGTVAQAGWDAAMRGSRVVVTGGMNKLAALSTRVLPRRMLSAVAGRLMDARRP